MWSITLKLMRKTKRMLIPAGIAIMIGTAFIASTFLFGNATRKSNQILLGTGDTSRRVAISLAGLDFAGLPVQETVSDMYERLDGSGFPRHLKGEEISKPARYLGIAEEVCTIMHPREGAFPEDWEKALAPILDTKRFDPAASRLFHYLKSPQGQKILLRLRRK